MRLLFGQRLKGYRYRINSVALFLFHYEGFGVFLATLATIPNLAPHILRSPYRSRDQVSFYVPLFIPLTLGLVHVLWLVMCIYSPLPWSRYDNSCSRYDLALHSSAATRAQLCAF
jgi:hypothetical protein